MANKHKAQQARKSTADMTCKEIGEYWAKQTEAGWPGSTGIHPYGRTDEYRQKNRAKHRSSIHHG